MRFEKSIVIAGQAGQGLQTITLIVARILKNLGFHVLATTELMSRIRGGINTVQIRVSNEPVRCPCRRIDLLLILHADGVAHLSWRLGQGVGTAVAADLSKMALGMDLPLVIDVPLTELSRSVGGAGLANVVAAGALLGLMGVDEHSGLATVTRQFSGKPGADIARVSAAYQAGLAYGATASGRLGWTLPVGNETLADSVLLTGSEAVALGSAAGGCNFIASYPMSPGTGVLTYLFHHAAELGVVAEQAEDEIAAINMAVGAWYAGGRGLVTTSGGGFALMCEGVSLAAMTETPVVVHIGQRPGPATGLPTRTEQGDLELALYAGHGEFPRAIFAPGDVEECWALARHGFNLADAHQSPVFLLTDQFLLDSVFMAEPGALALDVGVEHHVVVTGGAYRRHEPADDGLSPRGVPGLGQGLVRVDSDEHDASGQITESHEVRVEQHSKRLRKAAGLARAALPGSWVGPDDASTVLVTWGSSKHAMAEAFQFEESQGLGWMHFSQVFPLNKASTDRLRCASRVVVVEGNATGQFARVLLREAGIVASRLETRFNGFAFDVEDMKALVKDEASRRSA